MNKILDKISNIRVMNILLDKILSPKDKNKRLYVILLIIYKFFLESLYTINLSKIYGYLGVSLDFNIYKMFISWVSFFILVVVILKFEKETFWFIVFQLLSLFVIIPSFSLFALKNEPTIYFIYDILFWLIFILCAMYVPKVIFKKSSSKGETEKLININKTLINIILIVCAVTTLTASYLYGGLRILISFADIYKYRLALRNIKMPIYFQYMLPLMGTILLPICILEYLKSKKYILVAVTLFLGMMLFSINGMKTWVVVFLLVFGVCFIVKGKYNKYSVINSILLFLIICSILGYLSSLLFKNNIISGIFYRTTIAAPEINYYYIDYIFNKQPLLLRGSILRYFFVYPYSMKVEFLIGGLYTGHFDNNANNGLLGDAYLNFKFLGVILYPFLYTLVFEGLRNILRKYDYKTNYIIILILIWGCLNTSFFTWLLTGGVILVYFIYWFNIIFYEKKVGILLWLKKHKLTFNYKRK
ncbi:O-antigen polymerase [Candidatus Clostridium stratigraminis]|uniref:O-antigen polymerase n=1 Tax=Candidatus Clostridium stratigraminis TaxID=3381661 RepID=A0ABW8T5D4_9CLOT